MCNQRAISCFWSSNHRPDLSPHSSAEYELHWAILLLFFYRCDIQVHNQTQQDVFTPFSYAYFFASVLFFLKFHSIVVLSLTTIWSCCSCLLHKSLRLSVWVKDNSLNSCEKWSTGSVHVTINPTALCLNCQAISHCCRTLLGILKNTATKVNVFCHCFLKKKYFSTFG